jgi:glycosyltransferase involved in cell wall biosynthesis
MPVWRPDPEYLRLAVQSVLAQTHEDWELVVVEDPSDTPAARVLDSLADSRIRHHLNPQRTSIVEQLNAGLALCRNDLVARVDADDLCDPARLRQQVELLVARPDVSVLGTQLRVIDHHGCEIGHRLYPQDHPQILRRMPLSNPLAHPSVMFRRHVVLAAGGYRGVELKTRWVPWGQDYELWSRLATRGVRLANHPDSLVAYRLHTDQVKTANLRDVIRVQLKVKSLYWRKGMNWRAHGRMQADRLLLLLPPRLVVALFRRLEIRPSPPRAG